MITVWDTGSLNKEIIYTPLPHPGQADLTIKIAAHLLKNPGMGRAEAAAFFQGNDVI